MFSGFAPKSGVWGELVKLENEDMGKFFKYCNVFSTKVWSSLFPHPSTPVFGMSLFPVCSITANPTPYAFVICYLPHSRPLSDLKLQHC